MFRRVCPRPNPLWHGHQKIPCRFIRFLQKMLHCISIIGIYNAYVYVVPLNRVRSWLKLTHTGRAFSKNIKIKELVNGTIWAAQVDEESINRVFLTIWKKREVINAPRAAQRFMWSFYVSKAVVTLR